MVNAAVCAGDCSTSWIQWALHGLPRFGVARSVFMLTPKSVSCAAAIVIKQFSWFDLLGGAFVNWVSIHWLLSMTRSMPSPAQSGLNYIQQHNSMRMRMTSACFANVFASWYACLVIQTNTACGFARCKVIDKAIRLQLSVLLQHKPNLLINGANNLPHRLNDSLSALLTRGQTHRSF